MGMDVYGRNPANRCGEYFRATIWSWRPLHQQIEALCSELIGEELCEKLAYNDGAGPEDQLTCTEMANRFERTLKLHPDGFRMETSLRADEHGRLLSDAELKRNPELKTHSPYHVDREHVEEWIRFLRYCGGFEVW